MHKLIATAIADFKAGGMGELPEGALDESSDLYSWLQDKAVDFIYVIDETNLPVPEWEEVEDYFYPEDYDGREKILALMAEGARRAIEECPTVNHWSQGGLFLSVCMDFEGHSPVFFGFKIYRDIRECIAENKEQGYVSCVDDRIVSHSDSELLSMFENRLSRG